MSAADKILTKVGLVIDKAEKKTAKAYEFSKKKAWEKKLEGKLEELYATLGKLCYTKEKNGDCDSDAMQKTIVLIDNTKAELKTVRAQIRAMSLGKTCSQCGAGIKKGDDFCSKCGAEIK